MDEACREVSPKQAVFRINGWGLVGSVPKTGRFSDKRMGPDGKCPQNRRIFGKTDAA